MKADDVGVFRCSRCAPDFLCRAGLAADEIAGHLGGLAVPVGHHQAHQPAHDVRGGLLHHPRAVRAACGRVHRQHGRAQQHAAIGDRRGAASPHAAATPRCRGRSRWSGWRFPSSWRPAATSGCRGFGQFDARGGFEHAHLLHPRPLAIAAPDAWAICAAPILDE